MTGTIEGATISVIRGSNTYNLTDGTYGRVYGIYGAGMADLNRLTEAGPLQHGDTDRGFRLQPRIIRLLMYFKTGGASEYWTRRNELMQIFTPTDNALTLRLDLANGARRQIAGHALGFPMDTNPSEPNYQQFAVDIRCPNPSFYNPTGQSLTYGISYSSKSFQIPMEIPLGIGQSTIDQTVTLNYAGTWRSYPYNIRIEGAITDCVITNESTGEKLDFTGTTISDGDYYEIDLRYSVKAVVDSSGANKVNDLTDDSDLASWHLAAAPEVAGGANTISMSGMGANSNTEIYIQWYDRFIGI